MSDDHLRDLARSGRAWLLRYEGKVGAVPTCGRNIQPFGEKSAQAIFSCLDSDHPSHKHGEFWEDARYVCFDATELAWIGHGLKERGGGSDEMRKAIAKIKLGGGRIGEGWYGNDDVARKREEALKRLGGE